MNEITGRIKEHKTFFIAYLVLLIPLLVSLLLKTKRELFLMLNSFHRNWLDNLFNYYTDLGDGFFTILLALFFFFIAKNKKLGFVVLLAYAFTGIVAQVIKQFVVSPRPVPYFSPEWLPFFIKDVVYMGNNSFPSGHSVTAFAVATVLALNYYGKWFHLLLLFLALLAGYSRIYLSQHFLADVVAGSFIGVTGGILCVYWCRNITEDRLKFKKK